MNRLSLWMLLGVVSLASAAWSQEQATSGEAEKAVAALEGVWTEAQRTNNPELIAPHLADKFIATGPDGNTVGKEKTLRAEKLSKFSAVSNEDMQITVFGDTAIASGIWNARGTDMAGDALDTSERYTDTWVRMPDGKWQCVASHTSKIAL